MNLLVCNVGTAAITGTADVITIPMTQEYTTNADYTGSELKGLHTASVA